MKNLSIILVVCLMQICALGAAINEGSYPIIEITNENFQEVLNSNVPVIIDVYADWCGPCKSFAPIYEELNDEFGHLYLFTKLNGSKAREVTALFEISAFPTIVYLKNGQEVGRRVGFPGKSKFRSDLNKYFE